MKESSWHQLSVHQRATGRPAPPYNQHTCCLVAYSPEAESSTEAHAEYRQALPSLPEKGGPTCTWRLLRLCFSGMVFSHTSMCWLGAQALSRKTPVLMRWKSAVFPTPKSPRRISLNFRLEEAAIWRLTGQGTAHLVTAGQRNHVFSLDEWK